MDRQKLNLIRADILSIPWEKNKRQSDEFAGVFLHSNSPFTLEENQAAFHSFRVFSEHLYPINLFISSDAITEDVGKIIDLYGNINVIQIPRLTSIIQFNDFSINKLLYYVEQEKLLYVQNDGHLIQKGWEIHVQQYDWLGAAWKEPIKVVENHFNFPPVRVGNGGFNFRRRSKCLQVLEWVNKLGGQNDVVKGIEIDGQTRNRGPFLAEDLFFCYFGFNLGVFEPTSIEVADKFSLEPIEWSLYSDKDNIKRPYGFHRIDQ